MRACGVVLLRGDVDRALRDARHTADPAAIERRVLRDAFSAGAGASGLPAATRLALEGAARAGEGRELAELRERLRAPAEGLIDALIQGYTVAHPANRRALVDWLEALQPLGAPRWTLTEQARETDERNRRTRQPRASDLDQPRSRVLAERLEAMLGAPNAEQRRTAAQALLRWPEPRAQALAVEAYLCGTADLEPSPALAAAAELIEVRPRLIEYLTAGEARPRLLRLLPHATELAKALMPALLGVHAEAVDAGDTETCGLVIQALQAIPPDSVLTALVPRFADGDFRLADALPQAMRSSPELDAAIDHAHRHGRDGLVTLWREHEIRPPAAPDDPAQREAFARALSELRARAPVAAAGPPAATRAELLHSVATGAVDEARKALTLGRARSRGASQRRGVVVCPGRDAGLRGDRAITPWRQRGCDSAESARGSCAPRRFGLNDHERASRTPAPLSSDAT
ncbi:MAG TPA: hypothetical protein VLM79_25335 [Kofleriaceae bacterium]|nr:hypothetical protein [Kofleriaceae bacterium]